MKKCVKCGKITKSNNLTICGFCGGNLMNADDFPEPEYYNDKYDRECYVIERKGSKGKTALTVILTVIVVVLIAVCCFIAGQIYKKDEPAKNTESGENTYESILPENFDAEAEIVNIRERKADNEKSFKWRCHCIL